jgi:hypothetical protein
MADEVINYQQPPLPATRRGSPIAEYLRLKRQAMSELSPTVARDRFVAGMVKTATALADLAAVGTATLYAQGMEWSVFASNAFALSAGVGSILGVVAVADMPLYAPLSSIPPTSSPLIKARLARYEERGAILGALPHKKQIANKIAEIEAREAGVEKNSTDLR